MRRITTFVSLISIILLSLAGSPPAAELSPDLADYLANGPDFEKVRVLVRPQGAVDGLVLKRQLASTYATRADRHREAINTLQAAAEKAQIVVMPVLNRMAAAGQAEHIKTYWIDNFISADLTREAIDELAARDDIEKIYAFPYPTAIEPFQAGPLSKPTADRAGINLRVIDADSMWALGYTGTGTLVANVDTGVDGDHPALASKWRGNNGYTAAESWFDPISGTTTPTPFGDPGGSGYSHGTATMGVIVGSNDATGDTVGVAFNAQWISTGVLDRPGADLIEAYQWLIDPDGDPNTEEDVPDVISNSWGFITLPDWNPPVGCDDLLWNIIDNLEAAGAITFWAAGNEGIDRRDNSIQEKTIRNPANRTTSEVNTFAVGWVELEYEDLDSLYYYREASRGPSECEPGGMKPDAVAPGVDIRTLGVNGSYEFWRGSSFSTPHVAGAAALLREYNPNATADEVKFALLNSAIDVWEAGDDSLTGRGLINIRAALDLMPPNTEPHLYIKANTYDRPAPGGEAELTVTVRNSGTAVNGVNLELVSLDSRLTVVSGVHSYGDLERNESADNASSPFAVTVDNDALIGERLAVEWRFTGDGYSRTTHGAIAVGAKQDLQLFTHDVGNVKFTISSFGEYGIDTAGSSIVRVGGTGFLHPIDNDKRALFEMGFLVGTGPTTVSDAVRQISDNPANDFLVDASGNFRIEEPGPLADQQTFAGFSDANAENPLGLFIEQNTYAFADTTDDDYIILEFVIHNRSDSTLNGIRAAIFADWDFPWHPAVNQSQDAVRWAADPGVSFMRHRIQSLPEYRGLTVVSPEGAVSARIVFNPGEIYDGFTEQEKWEYMNAGFDSVSSGGVSSDFSHIITTGDYDLAPGDSAIAAFAVIGAFDYESMLDYAARAQRKYQCLLGLGGEVDLETSPGELTFYAETGGELPVAQQLEIDNLCGDTAWAVMHTQTWLSVTPSAGITPQTIDVSVVDIDLAVGEYQDTLVIYAPDTDDTTRVPVILDLAEGLPHLRVVPDWLSFSSVQYGPDPARQSFWIYNDGFTAMDWTAVNDSAWLYPGDDSGIIEPGDSAEVEVTIESPTPNTMDPGEHRDTIFVEAPAAPESPQKVAVVYTLVGSSTIAKNEPNPFNPATAEVTVINPGLTGPATVEIKIYDLTGVLVRTLFAGWLSGGETVEWNGAADDGPIVAAGVYLCHIKINSDNGTREQVLKIAVMKD